MVSLLQPTGAVAQIASTSDGAARRLLLSGLDPFIAQADFRGNTLPSGVSFARGSRGTAFGPAGVLQDSALDIPRFEWDRATLLPLGLLVEPERQNMATNSRAGGAVSGSPGTIPTGWTVTAGALLVQTTVTAQNGVPGVALRFQGTPAVTTARVIGLSAAAGSTASWRGSVYLRLLAGSLANVSGDGGFVLRIGATGATAPLATLLTNSLSGGMFRAELSRSSVASDGLNIRWNYLNIVDPVDFTMFVGGPQLELAASASSLVLNPASVAGPTTRAADIVSYAAPNGLADELFQDTFGGEWREGITVSGGSRPVIPIAGRSHARRARLYAPGTAAANPTWAVAA